MATTTILKNTVISVKAMVCDFIENGIRCDSPATHSVRYLATMIRDWHYCKKHARMIMQDMEK